jgi:hypothetical protein
MIQTSYTVHNPHMTPNATRAVVKGVDMVATVDTFEVELVADDLSHGGIKLRFVGSEIEGAQDLFVADAKVTATFASAAAVAAAPKK